jgi:hypothetical protein
MVSRIRLYVEGGGPDEETKRPLREGLASFLRELCSNARRKRIPFKLIPGGSRGNTLDLFSHALKDDPDAFNVLLIDADHPVTKSRLEHIKQRFKTSWRGVEEMQCHLMVQVMESWFVADPAALKTFYSDGFNARPLPKSKDVETVDKDTVLKALENATRKAKKGKYHKIKHASDLLSRIDPAVVRRASRHCDCLFRTLEELIERG